jgi:hypothetical protein
MAFFFIVSNQGRHVIDIQGGVFAATTPLDAYTQNLPGKQDNQLWSFEEPPASQNLQGYYFLQSKQPSAKGEELVINIEGSSNVAPTHLDVYPKTPSASGVTTSQLWWFAPAPAAEGWFFITSWETTAGPNSQQLVIEIQGGSQERNTLLQVNLPKTKDAPGGNDYQLWQFVDENENAVTPPPPPTGQAGNWPGGPGRGPTPM